MNTLTNQLMKKAKSSIVWNQADDGETSNGGNGTGTKGTKPKEG